MSSFPVSVLPWAGEPGEAAERGQAGVEAALARPSAEDGCARGGRDCAGRRCWKGGGTAGALLTLSLPFAEAVCGRRSGQTGSWGSQRRLGAEVQAAQEESEACD